MIYLELSKIVVQTRDIQWANQSINQKLSQILNLVSLIIILNLTFIYSFIYAYTELDIYQELYNLLVQTLDIQWANQSSNQNFPAFSIQFVISMRWSFRTQETFLICSPKLVYFLARCANHSNDQFCLTTLYTQNSTESLRTIKRLKQEWGK